MDQSAFTEMRKFSEVTSLISGTEEHTLLQNDQMVGCYRINYLRYYSHLPGSLY